MSTALPTRVKTRFAPSPTGLLHIGGARTALFSWAFARQLGGAFVLRIEDTDLERSTQASTQAILDGMKWIGLDWDGDLDVQSHSASWHQEMAQQLIDAGVAFRCFDSAAPAGAGEASRRGALAHRSPWRDRAAVADAQDGPFTVRLRAPDSGTVEFVDAIKGPISIGSAQIDDWVILRSDGSPTYNFACALDDWRMGITHVIRGDDHVANTPKQILIWRALGAQEPVFAHLPMLLDSNGKKLSKRNQGDLPAGAFPSDLGAMREAGIVPEALVNFLARLGWGHGDDEVFDAAQFVQWFDLSNVQAAPAKVNLTKLHWINAQHLRLRDDAGLWDWARERVSTLPTSMPATWGDVANALRARGRDTQAMEKDVATLEAFWKEQASPQNLRSAAPLEGPALAAALAWPAMLAASDWTVEGLDAALKGCAQTHGCEPGSFLRPLRESLTVAKVSLPIPAMLLALGRDNALAQAQLFAASVQGVPGAPSEATSDAAAAQAGTRLASKPR